MANTTSGTYTFGKTFSIDDIIEEAYERCGQQAMSCYQLQAARRSLNILFQEWGNRGIHFWEIGSMNVSLAEGQSEYIFYREPADETAVSSAFNASGMETTLSAAIASTTATTGITLTSVSGFPTNGTVQVGTENITYTGISGTELTGVVRGANNTTAATHSDGAKATAIVIGMSDILSAALRANLGTVTQADTPMTKVDRSTYSGFSNKLAKGTPNQFWVQRFIDRVTMNIYLTADSSNASKVIQLYYIRRIQDAGKYGNASDVPFRFVPCMVAGLAFYLSQKWAIDRTANLKLYYEDELARALQEDGSASSTYITPKTYYPSVS